MGLESDRPQSLKLPRKSYFHCALRKILCVFNPQRPNGPGAAAGTVSGLEEPGSEPDGGVTAQRCGDGHLLLVVRK